LIAAIILAAGKSERMGRPKALLYFQGRTFLERILHTISQSHIEHTVIVVGHHRNEIEKAVAAPLIFNPNYEQGMSTSVQAGLRALPPNASAAAVFLVDHPLIEPGTINDLIGALKPGCIVLPVYKGRRGHPVVFAAELFKEILELSPHEGLNMVVRRDPGRVIEVQAASSGVLNDIDTPEQFAKLLAENPDSAMLDF
jgi:molybdenum cofactor cytidylyltransferase